LIDSYARWRSSRLGAITDGLEQALLLELLGPLTGKMLLDVGCGDGALAAVLARRGAQVTGLDSDPLMVAAARRRAEREAIPLTIVEGKGEALPFHRDAFDVTLAVTSLCFIQDVRQAIAEMARVLKPGGRLVIGELGRWSLWAMKRRIRGWLGNATWHAAAFRTAAELRSLVEAAGLEVTSIRGAAYYPPFALAAELLAAVDSWLGRTTIFGAAFIVVAAKKPLDSHAREGPILATSCRERR
jgi:ubiquinone/menaquinone biosynthesis C-methylase UbiE